ncbi:LysR family transcriptional regulator [Bordetella sp. BOR01]|uniref:LysR family transcriptional regulator n=1 Tax=Bordetella sp. BOR01 TaxID=2854779 RepID=UPI001C462EC2|nr:LysR family transcriptional regulator [Bordetella sp. BOR01]MBV7483360.1 LysR family transcriptional regulator [Bordetella sp. BOR01]
MAQPADSSFFLAIVKHGSISAAARALGVSPPALSKRLAQLEERLGVQLLHRNTRAMNLTQEGQLYYDRTSQLNAEFDKLEQDVMNRRFEPSGVLRVNAPLNFGRVRAAPMISAFVRAYPKLEVELILSDHPYSLIEGGFDAAIRFGAMPDSGMRARRIATNRRHLWASPAYLAEYGTPTCPKDLIQHQCIVVLRSDDTYGVWNFTRGDIMENVKIHGSLRCNDSEVALAWALEGQGILMRSAWDTGRYARTDELRIVLEDYALPNRDLYVVFPDGAAMSAKMRAFIDFAVEHLSDVGRT